MSVHGEYLRSLRILEVRLAEAGDAFAAPWLEALANARVDGQRDLSTAARAALALLDRLEAEAVGPDAERRSALRDACHHLRAHCRAILGLAAAEA